MLLQEVSIQKQSRTTIDSMEAFATMSNASKTEDETSVPRCTPTYDVNDPHQQEVSRILDGFQQDLMGVLSLGKDGIMRSLTADRKVLSAEPFGTQDINRVSDTSAL
jgi:hypothetical protein